MNSIQCLFGHSLDVKHLITTTLVVAGLFLWGCGQSSKSTEQWQVVQVNGPAATGVSSLAAGATVTLEQDALVLRLRDARLRLPSEVSRGGGRSTTIELLDDGFGKRKLRFKHLGEDRAELIWPGPNGTTVFELERGAQ
jgi:hypothetical protein